MKYKRVADSSSNVLKMEGIDFESVSLKIVTDDRIYDDDEALDTEAMVEELQSYKGRSGKSCPNVHDWMTAFGDADAVFVVTITSTLSGSFGAAKQAALTYQEEHPEVKVHIIDSLSAGPEIHLILEKLKELIEEGLSFEEIRDRIDAYTTKTHLLFSLESLKNLVQNGRVSPAVAAVAGILGLRIVGRASAEGTLEPLHKCRGEKKAIPVICREMKMNGYAGGKVRIAHCQNEKMAEKLAGKIREEFPESDIEIYSCRGLCSFYAEKGGLMVGFEE